MTEPTALGTAMHGLEEIEGSFDRLLASHRRLRMSHADLLAAAKEALAMISDGHAEDAWIPLEPAIANAEKLLP